jgi:hypothetical protein
MILSEKSGNKYISSFSASANFLEVIMETSKFPFDGMNSGKNTLKLSCADVQSNEKSSKKHSIMFNRFNIPLQLKQLI